MYFDILHAFCHSDKRKICAEVGKNWEALLADVLLALRFVREADFLLLNVGHHYRSTDRTFAGFGDMALRVAQGR